MLADNIINLCTNDHVPYRRRDVEALMSHSTPGNTAAPGEPGPDGAHATTLRDADADADADVRPVVRWEGWGLLVLLFLIAATLYLSTAARGIQWQDRGAFVIRVMENKPLNELGLALSHPVHFYLSRLAVLSGIAEPSFAVVMISALSGAAAVALLGATVLTLTGSRSAAVYSAMSLMIANSFWQMATVAEVYSLTAGLLALELLGVALYARTKDTRFMLLAFLANGVGISNHLQAGLTSPILVAWLAWLLWKKKVKPVEAVWAFGLMVAGAGLYLYFIAAEFFRTGDFLMTVRSALFGLHFREGVLNTADLWELVGNGMAFTLLAYPHLLLAFAVVGCAGSGGRQQSRAVHIVLLAGLFVHALFALRYRVVDQYTFFMPMFLFLALFGGIGYHIVARPQGQGRYVRGLAWLLLLMTPLLYALVPSFARSMQVLGDKSHNKPYRDDYIYLFTPWSIVETSAQRIAHEAVDLAGNDGAIIYEDGMISFALQYRCLMKEKKDVVILRSPADEIVASAGERPIVLVPRDRDKPETNPGAGRWKRVGDLYVWRQK